MIEVPFEVLSVRIQKKTWFGWKTIKKYLSKQLADHDFDLILHNNGKKILRKL